MTNNVTKPPTITIRNLPRDKQIRIQELAKQSYKSMNTYLCDILSDIAERYEVKETESRYAELLKQTIESLNLKHFAVTK